MKHKYISQEVLKIGEIVLCDLCNEDYSNSTESGGFLFASYAYCPKCAVSSLERIKGYKEERYIKAWCPKGVSYRDWVLALRCGDNSIRITSIETKDE